MPRHSDLPEKSTCIYCNKVVTRSDEPWSRDEYYDEDLCDYDNNGLRCEDGDPHVIPEMPITIYEELELADVL